jgi:predicted HTH domain antitoxin
MIVLQIPDSIVQAIRLPEKRLSKELIETLAIALYVEGLLSFGKARELAGLGAREFGKLLGERRIPRHYGPEELSDDLAYADRQ